MSFPEITALSRHLSGSDPSDRTEQGYNLERMRELCEYVRRKNGPELAACLDATAQLIEALVGPGEAFERWSVHAIACRLLATVEGALTSFDDQNAEKPAPRTPVLLDIVAPAAVKPAAGRHANEQDHVDGEEGTDERPATAPARDGQPSFEPKGNPELPLITNMVFGRLIVELGYATRDQVAQALKMHRTMGLPIGECLLLKGATSPDQLLEALSIQERLRTMSAAPAQPEELAPPEAEPQPRFQPPGSEPDDDARILVTKQIFFGEVLLGMSMITKHQLETAMRIHHFEGLRVGQALIKIGALTLSDVERGLKIQRSLLYAAGLPVE